jgi:methanol--5-hydroxybenzimidazolylcobamide Co-methyltransferase
VLRPDVVVRLALEIVGEPTPYLRTRRAALATLSLLRRAQGETTFALSTSELRWLDRLSRQADALPEDENEFFASMRKKIDLGKVRLEEYDLPDAGCLADEPYRRVAT